MKNKLYRKNKKKVPSCGMAGSSMGCLPTANTPIFTTLTLYTRLLIDELYIHTEK